VTVYNFRFSALPVTVHLVADRRFIWTRIVGVQVGGWFIGAIQGRTASAQSEAAVRGPEENP
jgi:hypothetical protein